MFYETFENLTWVASKQTGEEGGGISKNSLILVMNEKRDKCLILMLNLKVRKQARSKASKNKVTIKIVSNISIK